MKQIIFQEHKCHSVFLKLSNACSDNVEKHFGRKALWTLKNKYGNTFAVVVNTIYLISIHEVMFLFHSQEEWSFLSNHF